MDAQHGLGVEEAFYTTNQVLTISFHTLNRFPNTGKLQDIGIDKGKHHAINVPFHHHISDTAYVTLFTKTIQLAIQSYKPSAIVLQSGTNSLHTHPNPTMNLSITAHTTCVQYITNLQLPLLLLGGSFHSSQSAACWVHTVDLLLNANPAFDEDAAVEANKDASPAANEDAAVAANEEATKASNEDATKASNEDATKAFNEDVTKASDEAQSEAVQEYAFLVDLEDFDQVSYLVKDENSYYYLSDVYEQVRRNVQAIVSN